MRVHSVLPEALTAAVDTALSGVEHVPHAGVDDVRAAELAASDPEALALIGPFRSAAVGKRNREMLLPLVRGENSWL